MLKSGLLRFSDIYFYIKNWIEIYILLVLCCRQIFMQIIVCENLGGDAKKTKEKHLRLPCLDEEKKPPSIKVASSASCLISTSGLFQRIRADGSAEFVP